jgi:dGTPase
VVRDHLDTVRRRYPDLTGRRVVNEVVRRMINSMVVDVITASTANITATAPADIEAVRAAPKPLITMSDGAHERHVELKRFLHEALYKHYRVLRMTRKARRVVSELFAAFMDEPRLMPNEHQDAAAAAAIVAGEAGKARAVADYIAGMTDRYAIGEHQRMFAPGDRS